MEQNSLNHFLKKHNSLIGLIIIAVCGGIITYSLVAYYYAVVPAAVFYACLGC